MTERAGPAPVPPQRMSPWRTILAYFDHPDPRVALAGTVALLVLGNQPFYPLYVWYAVGHPVPAAALTLLTAPLFAAAPAVARRAATRGRALLLVAAIGNTILAAAALGPATFVELFFCPCLLVAWALFAPGRRRIPVTSTGLAVLAGLLMARAVPPLAGLSGGEAQRLAVMHAISVACLLVVVVVRMVLIGRVSRTVP